MATGYTRPDTGRTYGARSVRFALFSLRALSRDDAGIAGPIRRSDRCVSATRPTQHLRIVVANLNRQGLQFRYTARTRVGLHQFHQARARSNATATMHEVQSAERKWHARYHFVNRGSTNTEPR